MTGNRYRRHRAINHRHGALAFTAPLPTNLHPAHFCAMASRALNARPVRHFTNVDHIAEYTIHHVNRADFQSCADAHFPPGSIVYGYFSDPNEIHAVLSDGTHDFRWRYEVYRGHWRFPVDACLKGGSMRMRHEREGMYHLGNSRLAVRQNELRFGTSDEIPF